MLKVSYFDAATLPELYPQVVPRYKSKDFRPLIMRVTKWSSKYGQQVSLINPKRAASRIASYINPVEVNRVRNEKREHYSISMGVKKTGAGYHGKRGDFCLLGASVQDSHHLTMHYRALNLIGGFAYDLCLINELELLLATRWRSVMFLAARAHIFAVPGNSNEKLYPKFRKILDV